MPMIDVYATEGMFNDKAHGDEPVARHLRRPR
jgi:hypothetical protein